MKIGIMQPYFFPYIGYWQLINAVDKFIIYDNIQFTKRGWIRRNRILMNGEDKMISLPIKKDSDYLDVNKRYLSDTFNKDKSKIINQIKTAYSKAPEFDEVFPLIESAINCGEDNLFDFIYSTVKTILDYLEMDTEIIVSSEIEMDHTLMNRDRVIEICKKLEADQYINPIGGTELYDKEDFKSQGITLNFIKTNPIEYKQFDNSFIPNLSIIDVLMFNSKEKVKEMLGSYKME